MSLLNRHFVSGKPAYLHDQSNPDWLPSLYLGHNKKPEQPSSERWERRQVRRESFNRLEGAQSLLSLGDQSHVEPTREQEDPKVDDGTATQTDLTISLIQKMQEELAGCYKVIGELNIKVSQQKVVFRRVLD